MRSGFDYFEYRFSPGRNSIRKEDRQSVMNFSDWKGKNLLKNDNFCTNLVSSTPSNGILSFIGLEIIFTMFIA